MSVVVTAPGAPRRQWIWQITALSVILGVLLALSLQTERVQKQNLPPRYSILAKQYQDLRSLNDRYAKEIAKLQLDKQRYERMLQEWAKGESPKLAVLTKELQDVKQFAGLTPVEGPGVIVRLMDSPKAKEYARKYAGGVETGPEFQTALQDFLVHDTDINGVVNELRAAGAEAISVNEQRLVATSAVRCVGPLVYINGRPSGGAPPYVIKAVGPAKEMKEALEMVGGYLDTQHLKEYGMVQIETTDKVFIPAYDGPTFFRQARPVSAGQPRSNGTGARA
ncbi:MAG: DUF881 domain-containing protein [Armatimonadota bacterium]